MQKNVPHPRSLKILNWLGHQIWSPWSQHLIGYESSISRGQWTKTKYTSMSPNTTLPTFMPNRYNIIIATLNQKSSQSLVHKNSGILQTICQIRHAIGRRQSLELGSALWEWLPAYSLEHILGMAPWSICCYLELLTQLLGILVPSLKCPFLLMENGSVCMGAAISTCILLLQFWESGSNSAKLGLFCLNKTFKTCL